MAVDYRPDIEPSNVRPSMGTYNTPKTFRFWCQKVLPLVYDDSLSYYELLCKVVDYLNKTMEDVNTAVEDVTNLNTAFGSLENHVNASETALLQAYTDLQNYVNTYFDNLDVQQEINNKLDDMVADGTMDTIILPYFNEYVNDANETINNKFDAQDAIISEQNRRLSIVENEFDSLVALQTSGSMQGTRLVTFISSNKLQYTASSGSQSFDFVDYTGHQNTTPSMSEVDGMTNPMLVACGAYILDAQTDSITGKTLYIDLGHNVKFYPSGGYIQGDTTKRAVKFDIPYNSSDLTTLNGKWLQFVFVVACDVPNDLSEVVDARIGVDGVTYTTLGNAIRTQIQDIRTALANHDILSFEWKEYQFLNTGGYINTGVNIGETVSLTPVSNGTYGYAVIAVENGDMFKITGQGGGASRLWAFTDSDYTLLSHDNANYNLQTDVLVVANTDGYLIVNFYTPVTHILNQRIVNSNLSDEVESINDVVQRALNASPNLLNPEDTEAGAISASGTIIDNPDYNHSKYFIPVTQGGMYTSRSVSAYALYDYNQSFIGRIETNSTANPWTFTLPANCYYVKASSNVRTFSWWRLNQGATLVDEDYGRIILTDAVEITDVPQSTEELLKIPTFYHVIGHTERMYLKSLSWCDVDDYIYERVGSGTIANGEYLDFGGINDERDTTTVLRRIERKKTGDIIDTLNYRLICKNNLTKSGNTINALLIGDSTIAYGVIAAQLMKLCSDGNVTLNLLGTISQNVRDSDNVLQNIHIEGRSGWSSNDYCYNANVGTVENPFYYADGFNFEHYMDTQNYETPDWVFIQLGINDKEKPGSHTTAENIKTMVDSIHEYDSTIKVGVCLVIPPYLGEGKSEEAEFNHIFRLNQNKEIIDTIQINNATHIVPINAAIDARYAFPTAQVAEGNWITKIVTKPTDQTHPSNAGYYQIADQYYGCIICN